MSSYIVSKKNVEMRYHDANTIKQDIKLGRIKPLSNKNREFPPIKGPAKFPKYQTAEAYPMASAFLLLGRISVKAALHIGDNPLTIPSINRPKTAIQYPLTKE